MPPDQQPQSHQQTSHLKQFMAKHNLSVKKILKFVGIGIGAIIVLAILIALISNIGRFGRRALNYGVSSGGAMIDDASSQSFPGFGGGALMMNKAAFDGDFAEEAYYEDEVLAISQATMLPPGLPYPPTPVYPTPTPGTDAEDFESISYNAYYEGNDIKDICSTVAGLKALTYVIFEHSNEGENHCSYNFKVDRDRDAEILTVLENLDPESLNQSVQTIKRRLEDYTTRKEILERKQAVIEETLTAAETAYAELTEIASNSRDPQALSNVIESKLQTIERLSRELVNISNQLAEIDRATVTQLDNLDFTNFFVNASANPILEDDYLKNSWKYAVKDFLRSINNTVQDVTLSLVSFLFIVLQYVLYILLIVVIAKYGWRLVKRIWKS